MCSPESTEKTHPKERERDIGECSSVMRNKVKVYREEKERKFHICRRRPVAQTRECERKEAGRVARGMERKVCANGPKL